MLTRARAEVVDVADGTGSSVVVYIAKVGTRIILGDDAAIGMAPHQLAGWVVLHLLPM